jgi:hypothetical protein
MAKCGSYDQREREREGKSERETDRQISPTLYNYLRSNWEKEIYLEVGTGDCNLRQV